jgi:hypothetical protein
MDDQNFPNNFYLQPARLITGIDETKTTVRMSPNPARESICVEANGLIEQIIILNQSGQLVLDLKPANSKVDITTSHFALGIYFVKIVSELGNTQQKLIIN